MSVVERFSKNVKKFYTLLLNAETPQGFMNLMHQFAEELSKDGRCKNSYKALIEEIILHDQELNLIKQSFLSWLRLRINEIKKSRLFNYPEIDKAISHLDDYINGSYFEFNLTGGTLGSLVMKFHSLCSKLAHYGKIEEFEEWMTVRELTTFNIYSEQFLETIPLKIEDEVLIIKPDSAAGKIISEKLGHTFLTAKIIPGSRFEFRFDSKGRPIKNYKKELPRFEISCSYIEEIKYPEEKYMWETSMDYEAWRVRLDYTPRDLLIFLHMLAEFRNANEKVGGYQMPSSFTQAEALYNKQALYSFLRRFNKSDWAQVPYSKDFMICQINKLFLFLDDSEDAEPLKTCTHDSKNRARLWVDDVLEKMWEKENYSKKPPKNYEILRNKILKAQSKAPENIRKAISDRLIYDQIRSFAKKVKLKTVRGPSKKG